LLIRALKITSKGRGEAAGLKEVREVEGKREGKAPGLLNISKTIILLNNRERIKYQ